MSAKPWAKTEASMKQKTNKKLNLNKLTIQDIQPNLDTKEQKAVRGGSLPSPIGTTDIAVYCR